MSYRFLNITFWPGDIKRGANANNIKARGDSDVWVPILSTYFTHYDRKQDYCPGKSDSIANQKVFLEDYTRRSGFTNIQHYTDDGVSGTTFTREDF